MNEIPSLSISSLKTYEKCPQQFRRKYLDKESGITLPKDYFLLGRLTHKILEFSLSQDLSILDSFSLALPTWLDEEGFIYTQDIYELIFYYGESFGKLLHRASPKYLQDDKLRKKDGSLLADPLNYPSRELRKEYENEDLDVTKHDIDLFFSQKYTFYELLSVADSVALSLSYALNFEKPDWISQTLSLELDLSLEEKIGTSFWHYIGYADWVARISLPDTQGIAILDFKTSKSCPTPEDVIWDAQLNFYALFYYLKFDEFPKFIGLYHLPSGRIVPVEVEENILHQVINHYGNIADLIKQEIFPKRFPTEYGSPCCTRDWKTKAVKDVCPFLETCWKDYFEEISEEALVQKIKSEG